MRNVLFLLTLLLAFATIARVVRIKGQTLAVAYEVRQLRESVADKNNENAYRRADVARRTTLQALSRRAEAVDLNLSIEGVVHVEVIPLGSPAKEWTVD